MRLPKVSVNHPIATAMFFIAVLLLGLVSMKMLPLDIMPEMELPTITVLTVYPGASADEVEKQVTKPLEAVLSGAEKLKEIKSTSKENVSFISLQYTWGGDIDAAANNARDLIELVKLRLPRDVQNPIIYKVNSSMMPILVYGINAMENLNGIQQILEDDIISPLRKVEGVGTVIYLGQNEREIQILLDPDKLDAFGLSVTQIAKLLQAENISIPGGNIKVGTYDFSVRMPGEFSSVEEIKNVVLAAMNGKIIRVGDIADVKDGIAEKDAFGRTHKGLGVAMMVQKQSGSNTVEVINAVRNRIERIKKDLPGDVELWEVMNAEEAITQSINNLTSSLWYALIFVTLVVLAFLRDWKFSLIIFFTMPVSLIAAFIVMYVIGYTINIFSLMSLMIAIGMVVDNAIVVLENITQHVEKGARPKQAAIFGASEMGTAIAASTATTLVVFIPMIFMGGVVGILFKQLAILTSVTLVVSLFTALTLTPMLSSFLIKPAWEKKRKGRFYEMSERWFQKLESFYKNVLGWAVFHKSFTLLAALVLFVVAMLLGKRLGSDYIPDLDAGDIVVVFETEVGTRAAQTDSIALKVMKIMEEEIYEMVPGSLAAISGQTPDGALTTVGFSEGKNIASVLCHLTLPNKRSRTAEEIGAALRAHIEQIPEIEKFHVTAGSILSAALLGNKKPLEVNVSCKDFAKLNAVATQIYDKMESLPYLKDVTNTIDRGKLEISVNVDKEKASNMGLNSTLIGLQVRQSIYGTEAGTLNEEGDEYDINVRYAPDKRNDINSLRNIRITNMLGKQIPLYSVADIEEGYGQLEITRLAQQRYVKVMADLNGISLGEATERIQEMLDGMDFPEGLDVEIRGQVTEQEESFGSLYLMLALGIVLVYMVMAAQFESFKSPFIVMFSIPFTLVGVILAFFVTRLTLSVTTFIGVIMLIGIVVNNGIILVDYTNLLRMRNYKLKDAVMEAGRSRLRPVLMTTFTTILGMFPMALSVGMGKEMFAPLGITIIGGLLISTLFTLIVIPTIYTVFHKNLLKTEEVAADDV